MPRLWVKLASAAVFIVAWMQSSALEPRREIGVFHVDPPTPFIRYLPAGTPRNRVLVIHGLDVSKEVMRPISAALADGGFDVYNIDLPGHGDSRAKFDVGAAQQAIQNVLTKIGPDTMVLGHSLGAGLLLDLAEDRHFSTMVLLSPPPLSVARIQSDRTLIATGALDLEQIRRFVAIATDIGSPHVESWILPWAAHTAPIANPVYVRRIVDWLGGNGSETRTLARFVWLCLMFVSAVVLGISFMPGRPSTPVPVSIPTTLVRYVVAGCAALLILRFVNPVSWLRLFATDYLIGFFLLTGLVSLCLRGFNTKTQRHKGFQLRPVLKAVAAAAFVIVVIGLLAASNVLHVTLSDGRWWRFPCIMLASLPLFLFDELTLRRIRPAWKSAVIIAITRVLLWAFVFTGVLLLNRQSAFLVLIVPMLVLFWIALGLAAGVVHKHTADPVAAAVFAAIIQGWAFAAWFVTI